MALNNKLHIAETTKLSDLTVGEFKSLLQEVVSDIVEQAVFQLEQQLPDPDAGKELRPEVAEALRQSLRDEGELLSLESVIKDLGLDG